MPPDVTELEDIDEGVGPGEEMTDPFDPRQIDISVEQQNIAFLLDKLEHDEIDMNTEFQRSPDLWPDGVMSRLIESLLIRFPLPAFYFDASGSAPEGGVWQVVDGLQRLSALRKFAITKKLELTEMEFLPKLDGRTYDTLDPSLIRTFRGAQVTIYRIRPGTPREVKYRLFKRVNTGGLVLNDQEIRHAVNQGVAANYLKDLAESDQFRGSIRLDRRRMQDRELVLRFLAFRMTPPEQYRPSMVRFLDHSMEALQRTKADLRAKLKREFISSLDTAVTLFGGKPFGKSPFRYQLNKALFEAWMVCIAECSESERKTLLERRTRLNELFQQKVLDTNSSFFQAISRSTASVSAVELRFKTVRELIRKTLTSDVG